MDPTLQLFPDGVGSASVATYSNGIETFASVR